MVQHASRWEFFSALNFEWSFLRGRREWNWTVLVGLSFGSPCGVDDQLPTTEQLYIACRVTTLAAAVTQMTGFDFRSKISCDVCL